MRIAGYCKLCREKEIELYGAVLHKASKLHSIACEEAECLHPHFYEFGEEDDEFI